MKGLTISLVTTMLVISLVGSASAVPRLQTYIVGSKYYNHYNRLDSYSWISNSSSFDLKVVGYWGSAASGAPPRYDYMDCYLAMSTPRHQSGTIWINGVEITSFTNYFNAVPGGVYPGWYLPLTRPSIFGKYNFSEIGRIDNNQVNAYDYNHGRIMSPGWGDEILLNVVVKGFKWSNFDVVGVDSRGITYTNCPDHDSSYFATPEPGTLSLLGVGLLGLIPILRMKKKS